MELVAYFFIGVVILIHLYIFFFECFAWETRGPKVFGSFPKDLFPKTKTLAFNQGVYNLFLAAGLVWTAFITNEVWRENVALFFLACVVVAGLTGAATASKKILFVQSLPALIAIVLLLFS